MGEKIESRNKRLEPHKQARPPPDGSPIDSINNRRNKYLMPRLGGFFFFERVGDRAEHSATKKF